MSPRINCYVYQARSFRQALSKSTEAVSLWPWRLQSGLRAGKSDSMDGGGVPPGQPLCMWEEARRRLLLPKPRYRRKDFRAAIRSGCAANVVDTSRAPDGKHIAWAYCHVPNSSRVNCLESLENQIERFAPGFRDCVLARRVFAPADLESMDANLVGGDIGGGAVDVRQFLFRPTWRQYRTSASDVYFCSSSSPPGGGAWHVWIQRGPGGAASFKQLVRRLCDVS